MLTRDELLEKLGSLKQSSIKKTIDNRMAEFKKFRVMSNHDNFKELCFCILTANSTAELCLKVYDAISDQLLTACGEDEFRDLLHEHHCRFYNMRARYIASACQHRDSLKTMMDSFGNEEERLREWLVENVLGLGFKEASHFMRNVGYENVAIIDFHIVDILVAHGFITEPKTVNKKKYLEIEHVLSGIGKKIGFNLGELDLALWYLETGKILK